MAALVVTVLTIAGVDSSGGAGIAADLKTFEAHGLWGACAVTAVTAQSPSAVQAIEVMSASLVRAQILAVAAEVDIAAVKTGMLGAADVVEAVAEALLEIGSPPLVVDPVLVSTSGTTLLHGGQTLRKRLLPLATVVTPNRQEAEALTGEADPVAAAKALGVPVVMVTGSETARDLVWTGEARWLDGQVVDNPNTHGSGCVLSAAIAAELARGMDPVDACVAGKAFVTRAIAAGGRLGVNPGWERGAGPAW